MLNQVKSAVGIWLIQVRRVADDAFTDLEPKEYFMLLVVCIGVGYVLLKGRS